MKRAYIAMMRGSRSLARRTGLLGWLERRHAAGSRTALWQRSLFAIYDADDMITLDLPWWTFAAVDRVEAFLASRPGARVFEWGSGASTVWLARRAGSVRSVEHDAAWHARMAAAAPENAVVELVEPTPAVDGEPAVSSQRRGFAGLDFADYVAAIDADDARYDLVVVDGRAREACFRRAVDRLAPGGLIVFDNVGRARYREAIAAVGDRVETLWTRGRTVSLPYPDQTAIISLRG